jgi:hypothetical protein
MGFISEVTYINQNMHVPSAVMADAMAREQFSNQFKRLLAKEKKEKVEEVREIEKTAEVSTDIAKDEEKEKDKNLELAKSKYHIDLKG